MPIAYNIRLTIPYKTTKRTWARFTCTHTHAHVYMIGPRLQLHFEHLESWKREMFTCHNHYTWNHLISSLMLVWKGFYLRKWNDFFVFLKFMKIFLQYKHIKGTNGKSTKMLMTNKDSVLKLGHELVTKNKKEIIYFICWFTISIHTIP